MFADGAESTPRDPTRILFRKALPQGLSVEINTLGPYRYIQVNFRELAGDFANSDPGLGGWSIQIPELIGNSDGFIFGFDPDKRWEPVPGEPNAIHYENESHPIGPNAPVAFAGQKEMINRQGRMKYRAKVTVKGTKLAIEMAITNLEEKPTSVFTDICNRFYGRGHLQSILWPRQCVGLARSNVCQSARQVDSGSPAACRRRLSSWQSMVCPGQLTEFSIHA